MQQIKLTELPIVTEVAQSMINSYIKYKKYERTTLEFKLAIETETYEAINEIQEWKWWKKGKVTNLESVYEELADIFIFSCDFIISSNANIFGESEILNIYEVTSMIDHLLYGSFEYYEEFKGLQYAVDVFETYTKLEIDVELLLTAVRDKIKFNHQRKDHNA